ncbi:hypothetical protein PDIG_52290 [Penicillium digitatum PHI26]|uniref:Uncharacterized protein n=2 Tax=Penicillium digitatum TaxID=36651 RepID=K9FRW7_PEND2|nr:hypothetical protein PDIP_21490 [Penicillium digitatum Pd1]EKV11217.1 hypothetical protein PDIG_52290 [Penicillium digitatum PHI26]EKV19992.1 hypothetical protein PDIP_21490 [Penicillium digitatum Pd1]
MKNEECQERICIDGQRRFACGCQDASKSQRNSAVPRAKALGTSANTRIARHSKPSERDM